MLHILTLSYKKPEAIKSLKDSLLPNLSGFDWKWHIRDHQGTGETAEVVAGNERINCITYPTNSENFAQGMNFLFDQSNAKDDDLILLLNNDVVFNDKVSLSKMAALMKDDVGIVGARLFYPNSRKLQHAGVIFSINARTPIHYRRGEMDDEHSAKNRYFQVITAAVMLCHAKDYRKVRMDENFRWAFDDSDFCIQVGTKLGKEIVYCGETEISHTESATLKVNPVNKLHMQHNIQHFVNKNKGLWKIDLPQYLNNPNYNLIK